MKDLGLQSIAVSSIDFGDRLRQVDENHAALLAQNIKETGLRSPIEVRVNKKGDRYTLIAGGHRLKAAQINEMAEISAFVFEATDDEARLYEIDENLIRHDLNPLDRAVFMAERKRLYEALHPETAAGVAGAEAKHGRANDIMSFAADTAERCGLTERTIQRAVKIAVGIKAGARARIAGTWLASKQSELLALARMTEAEQHKALDLLLGESPKARNVESARKIIAGVIETEKSASDQAFDRLMTAWGRADPKAQKRFLDEIQSKEQVAA